MQLTLEQLNKVIPGNQYVEQWHAALAQLLPDYGIDTPNRIACFLAQCKHESGSFTAIKENLNYRAESLTKVWPKYFPSLAIAEEYAHNQEKIANRAYANRMGNGDEASGDGYKFCGRGLIQLTGKDNYQGFADSLGISVEEASEYMETFEGCVQSACWFWETNNLNQWADAADMVTLTKKINGGTLGLEERQHFYNDIKTILSA